MSFYILNIFFNFQLSKKLRDTVLQLKELGHSTYISPFSQTFLFTNFNNFI